MAAETSGTRLDLDRLIFFSDGVFAIAITLLALDLRLPPGDDVSTSADLTRAILRTAPRFLSFFISFQVIGVFWLAHHRIFGLIGRFERGLAMLNLLFLLCIVFMPFPTSILGEHPNLPAAVAQLKLDGLSTRLLELPGVEAVTTSLTPPLSGRPDMELPHVYRNGVAPSYFGVMNLPIVRGQAFGTGERNGIIVSESAARAIWPDRDPLGQVWKMGGAERVVVGVTKDSGANLFTDSASVEIYTPIPNEEVERSALILHTRGDPAPLVRVISAVGSNMDETVSVSLMRASRENSLAAQRRMITLIGSIGAVATVLAAAGMFALVAFTVGQRKRELGIRIAIGARPFHILSILLRENLKPMAIGSVAGVVLALAMSRLVRSMIVLRDGDAVDVIGFAAGLASFGLVAALATLSPAVRALRIDPSVTLRDG